MPSKSPSIVPKLRGREAPKEDMNLIYSVLENITASDTFNKGLLKFDAAKAAERANISSEGVLRTRWHTYRVKFKLNDNLPVDPNKAHFSSIEPRLRDLKPKTSVLNVIFSILENLKEKPKADWAKVAERAGLKSADEAQQAWKDLCAKYQLCNEEVAVWRAPNAPCPNYPRVVVANELQPAFISVADSISASLTSHGPLPPCTPIWPTVTNVPFNNNLLPAPASVPASAPVNTPAVTRPHAPGHPHPQVSGTHINNNNHPVNKEPANYTSTGTPTDAKCCPTKAFGFKVVARALLWRSILVEEENEREQHERVLGLSSRGSARPHCSWSFDTPKRENEPGVNGEPRTTSTTTSTNEGTRACRGTQTEDPCCRVTAFGFRVAFVYMFVMLDNNAYAEEESASAWPLDHIGAEAEPVANTTSSSSSSSSSSRSNSIFSNSSATSTTTTPTTSPFPTPTTGLTGTPFSPTTKKAKTLLDAARYMWSLSAKAEYERDESLGEWPGWLLLDQGGGGGVSSTAYENAVAAAVAPLRFLWLRVAVMIEVMDSLFLCVRLSALLNAGKAAKRDN
ncbi:hypothetical protein B0H65DRAFT_508782 [Neurospora tetraspora]|uniref:Uncharacterized protein n=1 Tax=Neurospora tetraspora TaxID=94610 RepID=A0AAE0MRU2_9PEZI|nr:hypothetical protein B0H65DRAFT_508782 [Neurospora tetraspora]